MFPDDDDALGRYAFLLTLSAVTRNGIDYRPVPHELVRLVVEQQAVFTALASWCGACSGLEASVFVDCFDDFCQWAPNDTQHFEPANLNTLLSLHCDGPVPPFPFIAEGHLDTQMVAWPSRLAVFNLVHALLRGRTRRLLDGQSLSPLPAFGGLELLLHQVLPGKLDCTCAISQAALDFIFWGKDAEERAKDAHAQVVRDLRTALKF